LEFPDGCPDSAHAAGNAEQAEGAQNRLRDGWLIRRIRRVVFGQGLMSGEFIEGREGHVEELEIAVGGAIGIEAGRFRMRVAWWQV
jgi:hypothetical protein